jgi:hypothetical protein
MTAIMAPTAATMEPAVAMAALVDCVAGPVVVPVPLGEEVATVLLPETTEVTTVELLMDGMVATLEATGAVVVALFTEDATPFPPP